MPVFWLCTFAALWIVFWATQGLPSRASVYRGSPCRDPPMCLDAQVWHQGKAPTLCGCWSAVLSTPKRLLVIECCVELLFCEHFVAPTALAGRVFFSTKSFVQQILTKLFMSFEISSHFSCLLPAVSLSILCTPMLICFTPKRLLIIECCVELLLRRLLRLRNCRIDPCGETCHDDVHVLCVIFLLQRSNHLHWQSRSDAMSRADALDLSCLVLDV